MVSILLYRRNKIDLKKKGSYDYDCRMLIASLRHAMIALETRVYLHEIYWPAGSIFSGNGDWSRFDMQASFQFIGVNLSTIALNASYIPSVVLFVHRQVSYSLMYKRTRHLRDVFRAVYILG